MKILKKVLNYGTFAFLLFYVFNSIQIYRYSSEYFEENADVAIVLGAGTHDDQLSPVFRERVNHAIYLFENQFVKHIILTGGHGKDQNKADSEIAMDYAIELGIPEDRIHIETTSHYTYENLEESKKIMESNGYSTALIVSDPLHMKRSIKLAESYGINCKPSPTQTSMYRSNWPIFKSILYESFYYTIGKIMFKY